MQHNAHATTAHAVYARAGDRFGDFVFLDAFFADAAGVVFFFFPCGDAAAADAADAFWCAASAARIALM
jgi:hypothetical protein